jgi:Arc/MetJ-type ribon-helix-helix transcriptional regulator
LPGWVPEWYRNGMSKQIAVRLPDDVVEFVDEIVREGGASSRAVVVTRALERERRRAVAARDAEILKRAGPDADMDGLAAHVVRTPLDLE